MKKTIIGVAAVALLATVLAVPAAATKPPGPTNLTATAGTGHVVLNWEPPADDAGVTEYRIWRRRPDAGEPTFGHGMQVDTGSADTSYVDNTANEDGVLYYYRVFAMRGNQRSKVSNLATATGIANTVQFVGEEGDDLGEMPIDPASGLPYTVSALQHHCEYIIQYVDTHTEICGVLADRTFQHGTDNAGVNSNGSSRQGDRTGGLPGTNRGPANSGWSNGITGIVNAIDSTVSGGAETDTDRWGIWISASELGFANNIGGGVTLCLAATTDGTDISDAEVYGSNRFMLALVPPNSNDVLSISPYTFDDNFQQIPNYTPPLVLRYHWHPAHTDGPHSFAVKHSGHVFDKHDPPWTRYVFWYLLGDVTCSIIG